MSESESTVHEQASSGEGIPQRVCSQLLADESRYSLWESRHEQRMSSVAGLRYRQRQLMSLRGFAVQQVHRTALVKYLRDHNIKGEARNQTLREFYGVVDPRRAAVAEHRNYVIAASSQICAATLLELGGDEGGARLIRNYEILYGNFFSMFCDRSRAKQSGKLYLLESLIPEAKDSADRARQRVMSGSMLPIKSKY